ncbi:MAG: hypothetical protein FWE35_16255 [Streptosporangiales bacterium]|nr:hypothetical protein [Streptosporangiales bacterium]
MARAAARVLIAAGAVALAWSGVIHLRLWSGGYDAIPLIGPLFLVQGIVSLLIAVALVVFRRPVLMGAGALTLAATAGGLLLSAYSGLFGYTESLAVPYATESLYVEFAGAAVLTLAGVLASPAARGRVRRSCAREDGR